MTLLPYILIAGAVFGLCFLADRLFTRLFRSAAQHRSGNAVRLSPHVGGAGIGLGVLGILGMLSGHGPVVIIAGALLLAVGICLGVYYLSFGIYYDEEGFLICLPLRKSAVYPYSHIESQQLYLSGGKYLVELQMTDGRIVQLPAGAKGVEAFMDKAFAGWCAQKGLTAADCPWYDRARFCWFPRKEEL